MKQRIIPDEEEIHQDALPEELVMMMLNEALEEDLVDEPPYIPPTSPEVANVDMNGENQENWIETVLVLNEDLEEDLVDEPPYIPPTSPEVANVDMNGENQENWIETVYNFIRDMDELETISERIIQKIELLSLCGVDWRDVLDEDPEDM